MKQFLFVSAVALFCVGPSAALLSPQPLPASGTLVGTVTDAAGSPLPGVQVEILGPDRSVTSTTDADGRFRIAGLAPGTYRVRASLEGFAVTEQTARVQLAASAEIRLILRTGSKATPPPPPPPTTTMPAQPPDYAIVRVFYATDRVATGAQKPASFYGADRAQALNLGTCEVSIPREHRMGELEGPSILRLEFREDPAKHVVLLSVTALTADPFFGQMRSRVAQSQSHGAFVFVHGYNVTFADAARRTAQMAYDLGFDGAPILYSWPSQGKPAGYLADEATVDFTVPHLQAFLQEVAQRSGASTVHLIAHSMGNRALMRALLEIAAHPVAGQPKFRELVLAAPDIDADVFRDLAKVMPATADRITLYGSSSDEAIAASRAIHQAPRAGDGGAGIVVVDGVDTIDASAVDTGLVGHSYYADNRSLLSDVFELIRHDTPPDQRFGLHPGSKDGRTYWLFQP